ncbi:MAG: membrane protein DedA with SNARE-associated domain [Candidatus Paceibacteria bacterium]
MDYLKLISVYELYYICMDLSEIIKSIGSLSYWGIAVIGLVANAFPLAPEEITLLVIGYLTGTGAFNIWITAPIMIGGMFVSDIILFTLARRGNRLLKRFKEKISKHRHLRDDSWVKKHIKKIIFISRFVIYFRFMGPVLAGSVRAPWKTFLFYDFIALCVYVPTVLFAGNYFQNHLSAIAQGVADFKNYFLFIIGVILFIIFMKLLSKNFLQKITKVVTDYVPTIIPGLSKKDKD